MIPNIHQSITQILEAADPIQKIIWQQIRLITGENAAVRQLYYAGAVTGSEFTVYQATKLYLALDLNINYTGNLSNFDGSIIFYNEVNAQYNGGQNRSIAWDVTAAIMKYANNDVNSKNVLFSRCLASQYNYMRFIGFRIIY